MSWTATSLSGALSAVYSPCLSEVGTCAHPLLSVRPLILYVEVLPKFRACLAEVPCRYTYGQGLKAAVLQGTVSTNLTCGKVEFMLGGAVIFAARESTLVAVVKQPSWSGEPSTAWIFS